MLSTLTDKRGWKELTLTRVYWRYVVVVLVVVVVVMMAVVVTVVVLAIVHGVSIKRHPFAFFHNFVEWQYICRKFLAAVGEGIVIQNI